jgi:high-affinity Fe2+/Pb2+ permease
MTSWQKENILTMICIVVLVLGLYWMSHSWHALWGLLLLANINYLK